MIKILQTLFQLSGLNIVVYLFKLLIQHIDEATEAEIVSREGWRILSCPKETKIITDSIEHYKKTGERLHLK